MKATTEPWRQSWDQAAGVLLRFGVERARLATFLDSRAQRWLPADLVATLPAVLAEAPDPLLALTNLERLAECEALARGVDRPAEWWRHLVTLLGGSQSLANWLVSQGADWPQAFSAALGGQPTSAAGHLERLQDLVALDWSRFADALRQYRHREYLRIGLHDLIGAYTVDATWSELSELAAGAVECAYRWARQQVTTSYGELNHAGGTRAGFVVLGMGKLGGGELNFSSDIDLVYLYESDEGQSSGGPGGALPPRAYFTRVAELLTRALQEVTERGFAFRVDLRLRPDGINGPIVNSVSNALLYYESYGQTWERTALLKARPIAGTLELGERFLQEVRPFVFRRYLDYGTLEDMQRMKAQIEGHLARKSNEWNVKLGRGGIREIEFIVQTMQLVHGGRDERVRCRPTLEALDRLARYRYLPEPDAASLAEAYRFLRNVEHKIQLVAQRQTHAVPRDEREQETLARRVGYRGEQARQQFWVDLSRNTGAVRGAFEKLFFQPAAERRAQVDDTEQKILAALGDPEAALTFLASLGFHDPAQCYEHLLLLRDGPAHAPSSPRRRQVLFEILPAMFAAMRQAPHPDLALQNMASFVSAVGARTSFLMLLRENPGTMRMLVQLFATSQYLANQFIRHPELLDSLVRADLVRIRKAKDELAAELASALDAAEDFEGKLDALRRFRNQEFLRIGINCVQDLLADEEVAEELTQLAEACLQAAVDLAVQQTLKRFELPRLPGRLVVLGLGKLGAAELNFNSDLDLIFVYDGGEAEPGAVTPHEVFTWLAQRLITVLQVPTKEGIVYRIDTRLRPSGHSGPLVSSLAAFRHYHEQSAQVWERQALIKARVVAGDDTLGHEVARVVDAFVYRAPLSREEVREIRRLRGRVERELAREGATHVNIKTGRGGLVDIEFLVQMLQLYCGSTMPVLRQRATMAALDALAEAGVLPKEDAEVLMSGYRFLRRLEQTLRLLHDRPVEDLERHDVDLVVVARRMGFRGEAQEAAQALWQEYGERRERIRRLYEYWFDRAEGGQVHCCSG